MENLKLRLNEKIDLKYIFLEAQKEFIKNENNDFCENQNLIYFLIHRYSNYEKIMWSFWKQEKSYVFKEIKNILLEISKLDRSLSWDCDLVLKRYKRHYFLKNAKSKWVTNENTLC